MSSKVINGFVLFRRGAYFQKQTGGNPVWGNLDGAKLVESKDYAQELARGMHDGVRVLNAHCFDTGVHFSLPILGHKG